MTVTAHTGAGGSEEPEVGQELFCGPRRQQRQRCAPRTAG